ncbi:cation-transporting P-type ATPase [Pusillimonas minor]|uniref:Cation-transporting P-type ATPase n=1 Tax=Pusillimonas minor TaxID=2697024 RepID=A0A842HK02_9BURK|nr:cation-transporting P-type ATPase [Pusillimonas minor]MBC2768616.1 cation-transporting P-type ATPase [Pusillimonas minor]
MPALPPNSQTPLWHTLTVDEARERVQASPDGLSEDEAARRLAQYGPNRLAPPRKRGPLKRFLAQFHNILLYIMLAAAAVTALFDHFIDSGVLLAAVLINAVIGFIQEGKAESALDAIRNMLSPHATVVRAGRRYEIDAGLLVPGDIIVLNPGDKVPADVRLMSVKTLRIEEAALTGESLPVDKDIHPVGPDEALGDRTGMAFAGTLALNGQATGVVVATGAHTELGKINQMLASIRQVSTPMMRQINHFSYVLALIIMIIAALTFAYGVWVRGEPVIDMFMMVVALVASAIPEGLPAIMTVTLALGVQRMARQKAIIRRLPAVETLGSVTVICSDKTGTLTRNEMTVQRVVCAEEAVDVSGVGYEPTGIFSVEGREIDPEQHAVLSQALRVGALCNDGGLFFEDERWQVEGDPTEGALLVLGRKAGRTETERHASWPRVDSIPFESENRYMATQHRDGDGLSWVFVKGAPERIIDMCRFELAAGGPRPIQVDYWRRMANDTAARGLRLLALAQKQVEPSGASLAPDDVTEGYTLLALVGIIDLPRDEAIRAVADCHDAGIRVKMITGDHADTAKAIGAQLAIGAGKPALTGAEIALLDDTALARVVTDIDVFARASPEHKLRLVHALQQQGHVVAMTGDGVNDAPALKRADVGVAMGLKGTEAAKDAADMVLADDNFATIAVAVREGRAVYDNVKKFILFMLPTNGGEALIVIAALLLGLTLPLTPAQVLWINMVTVSTLGLALAFEQPESGIMRRDPRPPTERILSGFFAWRVVFVSVLMGGGALGLFVWEIGQGTDLDVARTLAVNAVVFSEMFYLLNSRHIYDSVLNREGILGSPHCLVAILFCIFLQLAFTYVPLMQAIFISAGLSATDWLKVIGIGLVVFFVAEAEKMVSKIIFSRVR